MEMLELARESLVEHLRSAGLDARAEDERVWIGLGELSCRVQAGEAIEHPGVWLVPFWFHLALDADEREVVRESLAGMGPTREEAAVRVAHQWVEAVLPPVRMMLDPGYHDENVRVLDMASMDADTDETVSWTIFAGPPLGMGAHGDALHAALEEQPPIALVLDEVTGYLHQRRRHWVKAFLTRQAGGSQGEVMIDNEPDPEALAALTRFEWPPVDGFIGFRQFIIMHPDPNAAAPGPETRAQLREMLDDEPRRPWWKFW